MEDLFGIIAAKSFGFASVAAHEFNIHRVFVKRVHIPLEHIPTDAGNGNILKTVCMNDDLMAIHTVVFQHIDQFTY